MVRIGWYARDGHLDLFPRTAAALTDLGHDCRSFFACHHRLEAERLHTAYGIEDAWVLGRFLHRRETGTTDTRLQEIAQDLDAIPLARAIWSELSERGAPAGLADRIAGHAEFWTAFLQENRLDLVVAERPSILSTCIAWLVCRKLGVRYLDFINLPLDRRMALSSSWEGYFDGFDELLKRADWPPTVARAEADAVLQRMRRRPRKTFEARARMAAARDAGRISPSTVLTWVRKAPRAPARAAARREYYLSPSLSMELCRAGAAYLRHWSNRLVDMFEAPDDRHRFFLLPLHIRHEWSNYTWMGLAYRDPVALVRQVAYCLPPGSRLYVKEHGSAYGRRSLGFYRALRAIPGVVLIHPFADTFDLIRRSRAVVTLGSTAGFEACVLERPTVLLGRPWYRDVGGCHRADTPEQLADLLQSADDLRVAADDDLVRAIAAMLSVSFEAVKFPHPDADRPENIRALAAGLAARVFAPSEMRG